MNVTSLPFFGFFAVVAVAYYLLPRRPQNLLLLAASYVFYATWSWQFPLVLLGMTGLSFALGLRIGSARRGRRLWLAAGILLHLILLAFFKYATRTVSPFAILMPWQGIEHSPVPLLFPIGISFYTLQAISYLVDVFRRRMAATKDFVDYALFLSYFPKLTSGPIEKARDFLPRLAQPRRVDNEALKRALSLILLGLARKIVIADTLLTAIPGRIFVAPSEFAAGELWAWFLAYAVGIYQDFAGYTDIVRGVSGLFGIELARNFACPLLARNFTEFWGRWHMSLSQWLREYVYLPLSRFFIMRSPRGVSVADVVVPPLVTMTASGLWHGANLHLILWGALMGAALLLERLPSLRWGARSPEAKPAWRRGLGRLYVLLVAFLATVLFRLDVPAALAFWKRLFTWQGWKGPDSWVFLMILPAIWIEWLQNRRRDELAFLRWPRLARAALLAFTALAVFLFSQARPGEPFIYQGF